MLKPANNPIDTNKLRNLLDGIGRPHSEISAMCGYGNGQINNILSRGVISRPCVVALESVFGIKYEDYAPEPEHPEQTAEQSDKDNHSEIIQWMRETIKQAVLEAFEAAGFQSIRRK